MTFVDKLRNYLTPHKRLGNLCYKPWYQKLFKLIMRRELQPNSITYIYNYTVPSTYIYTAPDYRLGSLFPFDDLCDGRLTADEYLKLDEIEIGRILRIAEWTTQLSNSAFSNYNLNNWGNPINTTIAAAASAMMSSPSSLPGSMFVGANAVHVEPGDSVQVSVRW